MIRYTVETATHTLAQFTNKRKALAFARAFARGNSLSCAVWATKASLGRWYIASFTR